MYVSFFKSYFKIMLQLPVIKELGDDAFDFVFEGSELLAKVTEGLDPETCELIHFDNFELE